MTKARKSIMVIINRAMNKIKPIGKVIIPNHGNTNHTQLPSLLQGMPLVNSENQAPLMPIKRGLKAKIIMSIRDFKISKILENGKTQNWSS